MRAAGRWERWGPGFLEFTVDLGLLILRGTGEELGSWEGAGSGAGRSHGGGSAGPRRGTRKGVSGTSSLLCVAA